jgi:hypothetical protein
VEEPWGNCSASANIQTILRKRTSVEVRMQCENLSSHASVHLTVRDYGPGVPASELKNIFQPFYRVAAAAIASPGARASVWRLPTASSGSMVERFAPKTLSLAG